MARAAVGLAVFLMVAVMAVPAPAAAATHAATKTTMTSSDGVQATWVIKENEKKGTTAWQITTPQSADGIMGFANLVQATVGQTVTLFVSTQAATYDVDAYRMGYYGGAGGRLVWQSSELTGHVQPACPVSSGTNMVACDNWSPSITFPVTKAWVQGQYLLKLVGSGGQQSYVTLTVWDPSSHATYVVMEGVATQQVFNPFGGYDLYQGATPCAPDVYPCSSRSLVVSFDRPYANDYGNGAATYLSLEYPLTRFMEEHGLNVTYWTDITLDTHPALLANHTVLISTGHDEEWSESMRVGATSALEKGMNIVFFGASPVLRKIRYQSSPLGPDREIVNYRDPEEDPLYGVDNAQVSQNQWSQPPADDPSSTLVGATYVGYNNNQTFPLVVSEPSSWLFQGTGLGAGAQIPGVLSTDFQQYEPSGDNPPDVEILAHSPVTMEEFGPGFADTTYYTLASSKGGVFSSGANSWITTLDSCTAATPDCPTPLMQRITGNVLRVFGAGPVGDRYPSVDNTADFYGS